MILYTPIRQIVQFALFRIKLFFIRRLDIPSSSLLPLPVYPLNWTEEKSEKIFIRGDEFTFINRSEHFKERVEWGFGEHGKLWTFHLASFEFLWQEKMEKERSIKLIMDFSKYLSENPASFNPYPASLRIINWIKYFSVHRVTDHWLCHSLLKQTLKLYYTTEWYLQNNHLLENGFAFLFAGLFFKNEKFYQRGKRIIEVHLEKQILPDGAHFELSPMYHQLMLQRILDCIQLLGSNTPGEKQFIEKLKLVASRMLGWMNEMKFENGDMPVVNDSANGIAPSCIQLNSYARRLNILAEPVVLKESGFRKFKTAVYECLVDVGGLEPDINAGHGHSDSLSFILNVHNCPFIIDSGISTYENNNRRKYERSTMAHNTVSRENHSQSRLWGSFRVGKRVKMLGIKEGRGYLESTARFYDKSITHNRRFEFFENSIRIVDTVSGDIPDVNKSLLIVEKKAELAHVKSKLNYNLATIEFKGDLDINIDEAIASSEFNKPFACDYITIQFRNSLITTFTFQIFIKQGV